MDKVTMELIEKYRQEALEFAKRSAAIQGALIEHSGNIIDNTYEAFIARRPASGTLRVQVTEATGTFPVEDSAVEVYRNFGDDKRVFYKLSTDSSGIVDGMTLPAFPTEYSQSISTAPRSGTEYYVSVYHPDFIALNDLPIKIYSGIETLLPISLNPKISSEGVI